MFGMVWYWRGSSLFLGWSGIGEGVVCVWDGVVLSREWFVFGMVWYWGGSIFCFMVIHM